MAYTPINWQTGDTITAEKLNRCDNGWGASTTTNELYSGSMTVSAGGDGGAVIQAAIAEQLSNASQAVITIDGTSYTCDGFDDGGFWTFGAPYNDYSEYPFSVYVDGLMTYFTNQNGGTYSIKITLSNVTIDISPDFAEAVSAVIGGAFYSFVIGTTTWSQVVDAMAAGKLVLRTWANAYDGGTTPGAKYAGIELVTDAYADSHGAYIVSAIVVGKGVQSVIRYTASSIDGALS
jgi:hypothetical protein